VFTFFLRCCVRCRQNPSVAVYNCKHLETSSPFAGLGVQRWAMRNVGYIPQDEAGTVLSEVSAPSLFLDRGSIRCRHDAAIKALFGSLSFISVQLGCDALK
jgi:hypothetical protein